MAHGQFLRKAGPLGLLLSLLFLSFAAYAQDEKTAGESFTIHLDNYFVELQGGQRVDLEIHYRYAPDIARDAIPDYRAVQILVEDALYGTPNLGQYWELTNREIVRRLLTAFPQFPWVQSCFDIQPRALLNIRRGSTVAFAQADLKNAPATAPIDQDTYYQARPGAYNILVPRPLKASVAELIARIKSSTVNAASPHPVIFDIAPFPLAGSSFTFSGLISGLQPAGPYSALVLPEQVGLNPALKLTKIADLGRLRGMVKILCPTRDKSGKPVAEVSLAEIFGLDPGIVSRLPLADAREKFFLAQAPYIIMEEKYAHPYQLRGDLIEPYAPETRIALFAPAATKDQPVPNGLVR